MWPIALVLALILASPATAAVHQCRDAAGNLFLTDDPQQFPPGCEAEGVLVFDRPATDSPPTVAAPAEPVPDPPREPGPPPGEPASPDAAAEPPVERWKEEARELSREYQEMADPAPVTPALPDGAAAPPLDQRLGQLQALMIEFRQRLHQAPLTPAERAEVEAELPQI